MIRIARQHPRIAVKPEVMGGKPCIKGTRIPVDLILRYLGDGQGVDAILEAFPGLAVEDVRAAAAFAADVVADEAVVLEEA
ncbi:MAG: DUF433 domain-containing protein [Geminicoccales bacterium]